MPRHAKAGVNDLSWPERDLGHGAAERVRLVEAVALQPEWYVAPSPLVTVSILADSHLLVELLDLDMRIAMGLWRRRYKTPARLETAFCMM